MTLKINMLPDESASGGLGIGVMTSAGNPWSVPDALANELVNRRVATYAVAPFNDDGSLGAEEVFKVRGVVSGGGNRGVRTVLGPGDSMTDSWHNRYNSVCSYDAATRLLTITQSSHRIPPAGTPEAYIAYWNLDYPSTQRHRRYPAFSIDANTVGAYLDADFGADLPNGALSSTGFVRFECRQSTTDSWALWLQMLTGWRLDIVRNAAQSGNITSLCPAQVLNDILPLDPQLILLQSPGINDEVATRTDMTTAQWQADMEASLSPLLARGTKVLMTNITPTRTPNSRNTLGVSQRIQQKNAWLESYARGRGNMVVLDAYKQVVDHASVIGDAKTGILKAADGIHYAFPQTRAVAAAMKAVIDVWFPPGRRSTLPSSAIQNFTGVMQTPTATASGGIVTVTLASHGRRVGDWLRMKGWTQTAANIAARIIAITTNTFTYAAPGIADGALSGASGRVGFTRQIFPNPLLLATTGGTTGGGVTGTVAANLQCSHNGTASGAWVAVASVVARPDGLGNNQRLRVTGAGAADKPYIRFNGTGAIATDMQAGRSYQLEAELTLSSSDWALTQLCELTFQLTYTVDGVAYRVGMEGYDSATDILAGAGTEAIVLHCRTSPMQMPSTAVSITAADLFFNVRAASGWSAGPTLDIELGRIAVWDVTAD